MSERELISQKLFDIGSWSPKRRNQLKLGAQIVITVIFVTFALFPIIWIFSASLNPTSSMANQQLIPPNASIANYQELLNNPLHPFFHWMWNSVKVSSITAILSVFVTAFTAYSFSRFRFRGRRSLLLTILLIQIFPNLLTMVALFLFLRQIGEYFPLMGLDSHGGLIMVYLGTQMGINIWLMKGYFDSIPREIDESAAVDGATHWQSFWMLIFPLVRPVLAVVGVLVFVSTFNEFVLASILLRSTEQFTLMVGLYLFVTQNFAQQWGIFAAGAIIGAIPTVVLYLILQDQIVSGLTSGAVKG
ncbi:MAG: sugar ABC transporter permease [Chloroflexota bacterium]|nr:MAG: sugar ABC transporter permease [Chloroflexota bacterium]HDD61981.1 sugar ABC transporter permease [Chloroflexota bacterium]